MAFPFFFYRDRLYSSRIFICDWKDIRTDPLNKETDKRVHFDGWEENLLYQLKLLDMQVIQSVSGAY